MLTNSFRRIDVCQTSQIRHEETRARHGRATCVTAVAMTISLAVLSGCSSLKVKLGLRVDLTQIPVASIEASLPQGPGVAPGQKSPLVVTVTQPDGKVLLSEGKGGGKVMWKDLSVAPSVVTVNKKGVISLSKDPRVSDGKVGHVTITVPSHPDVKAAYLDIPFRYDIAYTCNFSGASGTDGSNGSDGTDGTPGSMGSTDPNNPSPGGDGGNGTDGGDGGDGGPGGDAPPVQVRIAVQSDVIAGGPAPNLPTHQLLQVSVIAAKHQRFYLVDPQGGSLTVKADGGQGGSGGHGGRGGRGGSGGSGTPDGMNGRDGSDGRNGFDGQQGRGGLISVTYDPQAKPYLAVLHLSSRNGPQPVYQQATVAALW